ncbi:MAG: pirin family protein [Nocardioidaceae bacterium]|nr:pirin family protein [Nocardioidaceae bacterium]
MFQQGIVVCRSADRFVTRSEGRETRHSFSFGQHYDPANTSYGLLVAHNDEILQPGKGYPMHTHRDVEIVTWVVSGTLAHEDSTGFRAVLMPGEALCLRAGLGVEHAEFADPSASEVTRFVQTWVSPAAGAEARDPETRRTSTGAAPGQGVLTLVASGDKARLGETGLLISAPGATLSVLRLGPGEMVALPRTAFVHVFVVSGSVTLRSLAQATDALSAAELLKAGGRATTEADQELPHQAPMEAGDAVRLTEIGPAALEGNLAAQVLVWEMCPRQ